MKLHGTFPSSLKSTLLGHDLGEVHDALGISPLVVVPRNNLDHVVADHHGERGVNHGRLVRSLDVGRHERVLGVLQDALELALRRLLESAVDLLLERLLLNNAHDVADGHVRRRDAERDTVELALHRRDDKCHGLGGTGGGRHNVERGSASAAEVTVASVQQTLVAGVGVGGGHRSLHDAKLLLEHLHEGRHAVSRARRVRDDLVLLLVVVLIVDTHHKGADVVTLARGGDEHLLRASLDVLASTRSVDKHTGTLDHKVDAKLAPRQLERVAAGHHGDLLAGDLEGAVVDDLDIGVKGSEDGVVLEQVSSGLDTRGVVDGDNLEVRLLAASPAAEHVAPDAAKAVDGHLDGHGRASRRRGRSLKLAEERVVRIRRRLEQRTDLAHARELRKGRARGADLLALGGARARHRHSRHERHRTFPVCTQPPLPLHPTPR
mmetsp:Transcript_10038/g.26803  ORF Transcript_10038/g.26803 Transcript_10038/m.26803 type:complete len:435 (+) Transcript_10038:40-1344(+)